jgi:hypothetical protein
MLLSHIGKNSNINMGGVSYKINENCALMNKCINLEVVTSKEKSESLINQEIDQLFFHKINMKAHIAIQIPEFKTLL